MFRSKVFPVLQRQRQQRIGLHVSKVPPVQFRQYRFQTLTEELNPLVLCNREAFKERVQTKRSSVRQFLLKALGPGN